TRGGGRTSGIASTSSVRHRPFPWSEVMAAGLGQLRLAPNTFWSMTPKELDAALRGHFGIPSHTTPLSYATLSSLMHRYPDRDVEVQ
ncbi:MAG: rcc01693 family protein, partial [Hyphomicrobiaceae bacterium]